MIESWLFKNFDVFFHFPSNITVPLKSFPFVGKKKEIENEKTRCTLNQMSILIRLFTICQIANECKIALGSILFLYLLVSKYKICSKDIFISIQFCMIPGMFMFISYTYTVLVYFFISILATVFGTQNSIHFFSRLYIQHGFNSWTTNLRPLFIYLFICELKPIWTSLT